jgi:hypothetical protein
LLLQVTPPPPPCAHPSLLPRALLEHPQLHHAVHLASIRKEVSENAIAILRAFRNSKAPPKKGKAKGGGGIAGDDDEEVIYNNLDEELDQKPKKEKKSWLPSFGSSTSKEKKFLMKGSARDADES